MAGQKRKAKTAVDAETTILQHISHDVRRCRGASLQPFITFFPRRGCRTIQQRNKTTTSETPRFQAERDGGQQDRLEARRRVYVIIRRRERVSVTASLHAGYSLSLYIRTHISQSAEVGCTTARGWGGVAKTDSFSNSSWWQRYLKTAVWAGRERRTSDSWCRHTEGGSGCEKKGPR